MIKSPNNAAVINTVDIFGANLDSRKAYIVTVIDKNGYVVTAGVFTSLEDAQNAAGMFKAVKEFDTNGAANISDFSSYGVFKRAIINAFRNDEKIS